MGAALSSKTQGGATSVLPTGCALPPPPPAPRSATNRIVGKRARAASQRSPKALRTLALTDRKWERRQGKRPRPKATFTAQQSEARMSKLNAALDVHAQGEASAKNSVP